MGRKTMNPLEPGMYHITSRCVRRMFLLGKNKRTGKDYSHRKKYLLQRIRELARHFAIAVGWEAILSNHLHLILANLPALAASWSDEEVIRRVCQIFKWKFKDLAGVVNGVPTDEQLARLVADEALVQEMRVRLSDPSWFMRQLLQRLAVMANQEDDCKGHFVEQRFKHRVITDERGLLISGLYVDLNELAAMEVDRPELAMNSSAGMRVAAKLLREEGKHEQAAEFDGHLMPISTEGDGQNYVPAGESGARRVRDEGMLETTLDGYLRLLDEQGRIERPGKGTIDEALPAILERLKLDRECLLHMIDSYDELFPNVVGSVEGMQAFSNSQGGLWRQQVSHVAEAEQQFASELPDADDSQAEEPPSGS